LDHHFHLTTLHQPPYVKSIKYDNMSPSSFSSMLSTYIGRSLGLYRLQKSDAYWYRFSNHCCTAMPSSCLLTLHQPPSHLRVYIFACADTRSHIQTESQPYTHPHPLSSWTRTYAHTHAHSHTLGVYEQGSCRTTQVLQSHVAFSCLQRAMESRRCGTRSKSFVATATTLKRKMIF
jgi:hypothetical protein